MYKISEQQAAELWQRCEAIKNECDPLIYTEIGAIIHKAISLKQLQNSDINRLYELLNRVPVNDEQSTHGETQDAWDDLPVVKPGNEETTEKREIDKRNHILLSVKANTLSVMYLKHYIGLIGTHEKKKILYQDYF